MNNLAWLNDVVLETGVTVGYWVLVSMNIDLHAMTAVVSYEGFLDQDAHDSGKIKILERSVKIDVSSMGQGGVLAAAVISKVRAAEAPVVETPVEQTPVEQTPVEETPVEAPVVETPAEETPV